MYAECSLKMLLVPSKPPNKSRRQLFHFVDEEAKAGAISHSSLLSVSCTAIIYFPL